MGNESELGKGLFGYRKSAVEQIMSDRDQMLRQAEGRVRAAESKVAELSTELNAMQDRNTRMDEQIERLRAQLEQFARSQGSSNAAPAWTEPQAGAGVVPPVVEVPAPAPVTAAPEPGSVADLPVEPMPTPTPTAGEPNLTPSAWDEPAAWSQPDPASAYQEFEPQPQPQPAAQAEPEIAYAPDDRYGYGEAAALTVAEPMPEPQPAEPAYEDWTSQPPAFEQAPVEYEEAPATYETATPAYEPAAYAPEPGPVAYEPGPVAYEPEPGPVAYEPEPLAFQPTAPAAVEPPVAAQEPLPVPPVADRSQGYDPEPAVQTEAWEPVEPEPIEAVAEDEGPKVDDLTQRFLNDELAQILRAAEESAARIVERARTTTEQQIDESNRLWHEVQAEVARFAAWRDEVEPVIHAVQSKVDDVRTYIDEVPERIREALAPVAESISSIDTDLAELASRATPPLLLTPGGVAGSNAGEAAQMDADAEPHAAEESFDWIPVDADPTEGEGEGAPGNEDVEDDQQYDVPFGEGWTEVGDRPFEGGPDHSFGANAG